MTGCLLAAVVVAMLPAPARASDEAQKFLNSRALSVWKQEDDCVAASIRQFPEQDIGSLRGRDRSVDACLKEKGLPPRAHIVPDP